MKIYTLEIESRDTSAHYTDDKELNPYETETAGFIPLEVQMERFLQNGTVARFKSSDFDSQDYRDLYLDDELKIMPDDELEDVERKMQLRREKASLILSKKTELMNEKSAALGENKSGNVVDQTIQTNSENIKNNTNQ